MKSRIYKTIIFMAGGIALLALTGCATSNRQTMTVSMSDSLMQDTVQIDIAGIKQDQVGDYYNLNSADYWELNSKYRNKLTKRTIIFYPGKPAVESISASSPVWDMWSLDNDDYLLIAADLPPTIGNSINWKLIIPMPYFSAFNFWSSRNDKFVVDSTGLTYVD